MNPDEAGSAQAAQTQPVQPAQPAAAQAASRPVPSVGRIVHYRLSQGPNAGQVRPAIIVRIFDAETEGSQVTPDSLVQLQVWTDQNNDELPAMIWATSVSLGEGNGQYCWPTYVAPAQAAG